MTTVLTVAQALGVLAVAAALYGLLPFWWALLASGVLVVALATAAEHIVRTQHSAPHDRRSGPNGEGAV
jgi:membrane protein implicated in regulation of membrane protease activity